MSDPLYGSVVALLNFVDNEVTDRSVLSGTFTPKNGAGLVEDPPTVMRLDGVDDYVSGPSGAPYAFPGEFCIEVVAKKSAAGALNYDTALTTDTSNGSAVNGWTMELGTVRGFAFVANGGGLFLSASTTINDGALHHWCIRRGADGILRLDKDGTQIASTPYATAISSLGALGVGRNNSLTAYAFAGDVHAVRITTLQRYSCTSYAPDTAPFEYGFPYLLSGEITGSTGTPVARLVRAFREDTGAYVGGATSDGVTGVFTINTSHPGEHTVVSYPVTGENLPALVHHGVIPI